MDSRELLTYSSEYGIDLILDQAEILLAYMRRLLEVNQVLNLTAITDEDEFIDKHLVDSLFLKLPEAGQLKILDVGTGGGFPGIPLAIRYPQHHFVLMDATQKKLTAVGKMADELGITNVELLCGRAEELVQQGGHREAYDVVVSRGVAALRVLSELCLPLVKPGGSFYSWKGKQYQQEIEEAKEALNILGGEVTAINTHLLLKTQEVHVIIQCMKRRNTPHKYPRNFGTIKKRPL
jgi:16S rRNA (guanine527-N7)-methyltransferase